MWCSGRGGTCTGSNRVGRVAMKFTRKMSEMGGRWPVGASIDKKNSIFLSKNSHFFGFFSVSTLPSVGHSAKALPSAR